MLNIPEEIKELFRSDNTSQPTKKKFKLIFYDDKVETLYPYETLFPDENLFPEEHGEPWLLIENDRIDSESLTITESLSESEELQFGSCQAAMMEIIVADVVENVAGKEFTLTVSIDGYELPLGIFTVTSFVRQADRRKRKITAYDRMRLFDTDVSQWFNELTFPTTIKQMRDSLCDYIGIKQVETELVFDSLEISKTIEPQEISGMDIMKAICELNGCFGHVNKFGEFFYIKLPLTGLYPSEDLFPEEDLYPAEMGGNGEPVEHVSTYKSLLYEDYIVEPITSLSIREQEGDIGANVGDGENVYVVEGNFLVYGKNPLQLLEIASTLLPVISGRIYKPASLDCHAMPWVEVGDSIRIITRDEIVDTFVMNRVTSGCQAMVDSIESTGSRKREEVFGINKQIIQLEGKSAVIIKNVEEVSVRVTDLKKQEEAHFSITSAAIEAEVTRAVGQEEILSGRITVNANNITAEVTRASKAEGELSGRITIESDRITAEVKRANEKEGELSTKITQTATEIRAEVKNTKESLESSISQTATQIRSEVANIAEGLSSSITQTADNITLEVNALDSKLSLRIDDAEGKIESKVSKGTLSSEISQEAGKITLSANRLVVNSSKFKLDGDGNADFSGKITGGTINIADVFKVDSGGNTSITGNHLSWDATNSSMTTNGTLTCKNIKAIGGTFEGDITSRATITGGTVSGASITGGSITIKTEDNKEIFSASKSLVNLGRFYVSSTEYDRGVLQSWDECTGMSVYPDDSERLLLWAGWGYGDYDIDAYFMVNAGGQVHATSKFWLHGSRGNINVYDSIKELYSLIGSGGGGGGCECETEDDCYTCGGHSNCYTCSGDHTSCGPGTGVAN